ncbi:MAG: tetratricopeptide repeat protein, partial [Myxococcales bacterium]
RELVRLWELRAGVLEGEAARALRLRTALCWLDQVHDPAEAVKALEPLLAEGYEGAKVVATLERVAATTSVPDAARSRAYALLEGHFGQKGDEREVLRVIEGSLDVAAAPADRARGHRRAAALHEHLGDESAALEHLAHLVPLAPDDESALGALRRLGERVGSPALVAHALAGAADASPGEPRAVALREEAATLLAEQVQDREGAARLLQRIFASSEATVEQTRRAGERLWRERRGQGDESELLPVLERLADLGPGPGESAPGLWRHDLLGDLAQLAQSLGLPDRSLHAWELRLQADPADREALDGRIDALEQLQAWEPLQRALQERADSATDEDARRRDRVRIAKVVAATAGDTTRAIEAWQGVEATFGREDDTVDALAELYARAGRSDDLQLLLMEAEDQAPAGARRAVLRASLAALQPTASAALELLQAALVDDPSCERARQGLRQRLKDPEVGGLALASLVDACDRADDWRERLELLEPRLQAAPSEEARAEILVGAATDHETRAGDPVQALKLLGRALEFHPDAIGIEQNLLRLAEQTGQWVEAVSALSHAMASSAALDTLRPPAGRTQELRTRVGDVLEHRLGDLPRALESHRQVLTDDPSFPGAIEAVARLGARLALYHDVSGALREAARRGELPGRLTSTVEAQLPDAEAWTELLAALESEVNHEATPADARHRLAHRLGLWLRDQLGARDRAEAALQTAIDLDPTDERSLLDLAELQRHNPGPSLVSTLRWLSEARGGDEVALREAAELALDRFDDRETGALLLEELLAVAQRHWQSAEPPRSPEPPRWYAAWSIERLVSLRERQGEVAQAIQILETGASLAFSEPETLALLHRAALLAHRSLGDQERAAQLYRTILSLDASDTAALGALAEIYHATGRPNELLAVRRRELEIGAALERRLELRLDLARVASQIGDEAQRIEALRQNLEDRPGHPASVAGITTALLATGQARALLDLLRHQADTLEQLGEPTGARALWLQAAGLAEEPLGDATSALATLRRAAALAETTDVLDALGRVERQRHQLGPGPRRAVERGQLRVDGAVGRGAGQHRLEVGARLAVAPGVGQGAGQAQHDLGALGLALGEPQAALEPRHGLRRLAAGAVQAAELAEEPLGDATSALATLRRAVALAETTDVLDALGRLHRTRGEPAQAVPWFERRLRLAEG